MMVNKGQLLHQSLCPTYTAAAVSIYKQQNVHDNKSETVSSTIPPYF